MTARLEDRSGSQTLVRVACLTVMVALLYWPTAHSLHQLWRDFDNLTYTHGYLILGVCAWSLWHARAALARAPLAPDRRALALLGFSSFTWLLAQQSGIELAAQLSLPFIAWTAVWAAFGPVVARYTAFAFAYAYFAVPIWSLGNGLLQLMTVRAVSLALAVSGLPAYVEGNFVHIPSGVFEIAGGCSGLHFFVVALALGAMIGEINRDSWRTRAYLLVLAGGLALLSNWIRVYVIIVAGHLTQMQHALIREGHYDFGWKLFAGVIVLFFIIARYLPVRPVVAAAPTQPVAHPAGNRVGAAIIAVMAVSALGPAWAWLRVVPETDGNRPKVTLPAQLASWSMVAPLESWQPRFSGADELQRAAYGRPGEAGMDIDVLLAVYHRQRQGKELVAEGNSVLGSDISSGRQSIDTTERRWLELQVRDARGSAALIWYGYRIGSVSTVSEVGQQLLYGLQSLIGAPSARIVALRAPCADDCAATRSQLQQLATALRSAGID